MNYLTYSVVVIVLVLAVLIWAIRSGQFKHQDRARHLPLAAGDIDEKRDASSRSPRQRPRSGAMMAAAAVLAAVVLVLLLSQL